MWGYISLWFWLNISLTIIIFLNNENLFTYLLAICTSSLEKYVFRSLAEFLKEWVVVLLMSCNSSLYILSTNILSDIWLASIFSHSVFCPFILFYYLLKIFYFVPFQPQKDLILMKSNVTIFSCVAYMFGGISKIYSVPLSQSLSIRGVLNSA